MPDIAMCRNEKCERRFSCYRYMAKPNKKWQSYAEFKEDCKYFVPLYENETKGGEMYNTNERSVLLGELITHLGNAADDLRMARYLCNRLDLVATSRELSDVVFDIEAARRLIMGVESKERTTTPD
jgi:hypothetical protein